MSEPLRILTVGNDAFLIELEDLATTLSLHADLKNGGLEGVTELIPAARTLLVRFDPLLADVEKLRRFILATRSDHDEVVGGRSVEVPVSYTGEDLTDVADFLGLAVQELIRCHTEATYTVAFNGFAPGFNYMICDNPLFDVPRRQTPRIRIPAGSVALAGKFGGIYPSNSPGGWQLLGVTPLKMWDLTRERAALLAPGDRVVFRDITKSPSLSVTIDGIEPPEHVLICNAQTRPGLVVTRTDRPALYQDLGRYGHTDQGVSRSGALDRASLLAANVAVGNPANTTAVEILFGGFTVRADRAVTVAVSGGVCDLEVRASNGTTAAVPFGEAFALDEGDELSVSSPRTGMRSYLALRGGFQVDSVLGSSSTDTLSKLGPDPIEVGSILVPADKQSAAVSAAVAAPAQLPGPQQSIALDIVLGPRDDWFKPEAISNLLSSEWTVTPESNRTGMRLYGENPLQRINDSELESEGTVAGSIQVPHSGQPVLFLSDHPLTGGYPVIAVLVEHHRDLAGQLPIGTRIRFRESSKLKRA